MSVANLATLPIQYSLNAFVNQIEINSWNTQVKLYIAARRTGMSHDAIMQGNDDNARGIVFFDGWIFSVGDLRVPPLGQISPTGYTHAQVYGVAQQEYNAVVNADFYQRDKNIAGADFKKILNPDIIFSPISSTAPADIAFAADTGDILAGLTITSYSWNFGDGQTGSGTSVSHYYKNPGNYTVTLTMIDGNGGTHAISKDVSIQPPPITVTYPNGYDSLKRQFSTPSSALFKEYTWNYGDGSPPELGRVQEHTFPTTGYYTVTLNLTLNDDSAIQSQTGIFVGPGTRIIQGHTIYGDETWYSGGTYEVQGNIHVAQGATLTIESGVTVKLQSGAEITVNGTLKATGVKFTWADGQNPWGGIHFNVTGASSSHLENCEIEHARGLYNYGAVLYISGSSPTITASTIHNCTASYGIFITYNASPQISNSTISGISSGGVYVSYQSNPSITGSTISGSQYGIMVDASSGGTYTGNTFSGNQYGAYIGYNGANNPIFSNNTYSNNNIEMYVYGVITGNVTWHSGVYHVGYYLSIADGASLTIQPGATVMLLSGTEITVNGTLKATGVKFTWADGQNPWGGIHFNVTGASSSRLENCEIEHARGLYNYGAVLYISGSSPTITASTIHNCTASYGIFITYNASPQISNSTISGISSGGVYVSYQSNPSITGSTISGSQYGIMVDASSGGTYTGNTFSGNQYGLYNFGASQIDATNNNWGAPSGPLDDSDDRAIGGLYNPTGLGNKVSDNVNYYPWIGTYPAAVSTPNGFSGVAENTQVTLTWNASLGADKYAVYYGTTPGAYGTPTLVSGTTATISGLTNSTVYYFAVSARNIIGVESAKTVEIKLHPEETTQTVLTVNASGNGAGTLTTVPVAISCTTGSCYEQFVINTAVEVMVTPDSISTFGGWSGACTNTTGNCLVTMNSDKSATATFILAPKAKVGTTGFTTLQAAYNDASTVNGSVIKLLGGVFANTLTAGRGISVNLEGGYNAEYGAISTETTIQGPVKIKTGTVRMKRVNVK